MQLIVNVPNENIMKKVIKALKQFQNEGVNVRYDINETWSDEFIDNNWREIIMNTHSANLDDENLYEAAARFYNEKYSN
jgi:hypothetical protein